MSVLKGICTDYVSKIDQLFHAPVRSLVKVSSAKQHEEANAERIARLRDVASKGEAAEELPVLWEGF